jgi:hypothetical protein
MIEALKILSRMEREGANGVVLVRGDPTPVCALGNVSDELGVTVAAKLLTAQ